MSTTITAQTKAARRRIPRRQFEIDTAERGKAPTDRLGQVRLGLIAITGHGFAQDRARLGFHRSAVPGGAQPQPLFHRRIDIADRQGGHRGLERCHESILYKMLTLERILFFYS